jgi:cell fate regulator YaaT (PSP1 superfamily)
MDNPLTVEVRFKGTRKAYFHSPVGLHVGDAVVVDAERGRDYGHVTAVGEVAEQKCGGSCTGCAVGQAIAGDQATTIRNIIRQASPEDQRVHREVRASEEDVRRKVMERVRAHELIMKVSDCEWQWDRAKLTIYFTAEKRVDFRALVRDLASLFRTRIELRQIGVRDEAARLGGVGRCGREYCCSTWRKELTPVNLGLAKDQHLSLNPSQISGGCGRLLCCLKYEHEFYVSSRKRFPREGKVLQTARGAEKVVAVDIFRERVYLRSEGNESRIIPLVQLKQEMSDADAVSVDTPAPPPRAARPDPAPATGTTPESPAASAEAQERRRRRRRRHDRRQDEP